MQQGTFALLFACAAFFFLWTLSPVWVPVLLGVLLAVVATPLHRRLVKRLPGHPRVVAAAITAFTLTLGAGLLALFVYVVLREVSHVLTDGSAQEQLQRAVHILYGRSVRRLLTLVGETPEHFVAGLRESASHLSSHLAAVLSSVLAVTSNGLLTLALAAVTSYYLLLEGHNLVGFVVRLVPLPQEQTMDLAHEFREACVAILLGVVVIGGFQAVAAAIGMWLFGVPQPLVLGALTGAVSVVPALGTAIVCLPVDISLFASGSVWRGLGFLVWYAVIVVFVADYVLRPRLMEGRLRMHSLLVLISLFGGLEAFGPMGLALGPLFCALFVALLRIYERSYRTPRVTPPGPILTV